MNLATAIGAIEEVAIALRKQDRDTVALKDQCDGLVKTNEHMHGEISQLILAREMLVTSLDEERDLTIKQAQQIGELKATLKEVLAQNMQIASRATEMLKNLEDTPEPMIVEQTPPKTIEAAPLWRSDVLKLIEEERREVLSLYSEGEKITIDPRTDLGEKRTKYWFRCHTGGTIPSNWAKFPGVEVEVRDKTLWFIRFMPPRSTKEVESQKPFRTEQETIANEAKSSAFGDDGKDIPSFLMQGPSYADQGRKPNDI